MYTFANVLVSNINIKVSNVLILSITFPLLSFILYVERVKERGQIV